MLFLPKKIALQNVVSKDSGRKHDKCLTYCQSHISKIFAVSPLFHKGVPSFPAISFGVYTKWFSVTCDAHSLVLFLKFLLRFWTETFFAQTTVSSALLHRNYIILLVQTPGIYISRRPGWRSAKSTTKTLSFHQMAHDSSSKYEEILRCLPHFLQNGEEFRRHTSSP